MRGRLAVLLCVSLTLVVSDAGKFVSTAPASAAPVSGTYALAGAVTTATFDKMLGLYPVPGAADQALVVTQSGYIRRGPLGGAFSPPLFCVLSRTLLTRA